MNKLRKEVYDAWGIKSKVNRYLFDLIILDPLVFLAYWTGAIRGFIDGYRDSETQDKPMENEDE